MVGFQGFVCSRAAMTLWPKAQPKQLINQRFTLEQIKSACSENAKLNALDLERNKSKVPKKSPFHCSS